MDLQHHTQLNQGATIPELSQPAHTLKRKFKDEIPFASPGKPGILTCFHHSSSSKFKMPESQQVVQTGVHEQLNVNIKRRTQ